MLPGLTAEDIAITFDNGILTIDAEYSETREEDSEYLFSELPVGKFTRSVRIDENVLIDKIEASMKDGVLTIRIPKAEESKPKNIKVISK
jgi:HSP20 family protein